MIASLTALKFDPEGHVQLPYLPDSDLGDVRRRANRIATLDGGAVFNDAGHSPADRTFVIRWRVRSADQYRRVQRLVRLHAFLRVAVPEGIFICKPESVVESNGEGVLTLLVSEQEL
ncbi:hypothetical protein LWH94_15860 [Marinobacter sp. G11]|uniref:hypothetical protein n=1 Tax=Marinobacter sp. G11 TaxID=2903522 RepID=UPI001E4FA4E5|nr:hypothetical protein [Marinobacter sp. G11]MCE0760667.1 hypothetical protein [Marinobacter sp. G11]